MPLLGVDETPILFVDFNQHFTCLCIGTQFGYTILSTVGDHANKTINIKSEPICMATRLFTSSLVTLVSLNNLRKLLAYHFQRNALICEYQYSSPILAIKMNRQRLVVCVETSIFIHNIRDMEMLHTVENTPPNHAGVIALSSCTDKGYLAYPGSQTTGTVFIFDALTFTNVITIAAHDGLLAALAFNSSSTMLATASERGTVVRVFSIPQGDKLMEFRRGLARCADICCLSFSVDSQFLVAASNTETVHIFKLDFRSREACSLGNNLSDACTTKNNPDIDANNLNQPCTGNVPSSGSGGLMHWVGDTLKATAAYLPHQVSEVFSQDRAFAFARIPSCASTPTIGTVISDEKMISSELAKSYPSLKKVAALIWTQHQYRLLVAGLDGLLHTYSFDHIYGGEATLLHSQGLLDPNQFQEAPVSRISQPAGVSSSELSISSQQIPDDECLPSNKSFTSGPNRRCFASVCAQELLTPSERTAVELSDAVAFPPATDARNENDSEFPDIRAATRMLQKRGQKST